MTWYNPLDWFSSKPNLMPGEEERTRLLRQQAAAAGGFADQSQQGYAQLGQEAAARRAYLQRIANGQDSIAAQQLRQGLQQNQAQQLSMAAGAAPRNSAMAARNAAQNMGRAATGMSGQAALAGLQERRDAENALAQQLMQARGQDLQAALGSRQTAMGGYTDKQQFDKSDYDKYFAPVMGGTAGAASIGASAFSDERLKHDIEDGNDSAKKALDRINPFTYSYKNEQHGKGKQFGLMAQDLEKAGLGHAVFETSEGKAVHGAKLATAAVALAAHINKRVSKLEGKK